MKTHLVLFVVLLLGASVSVQARVEEKSEMLKEADVLESYNIDKAHSSISFTIRHIMTPVRGQLSGIVGEIVINRNFLDKSSVSGITIPVETLATSNEKRDNHVKDGFFKKAEYPQILFQSTSFKPAKKGLGLLKKGGKKSALPQKWILVGDLQFLGKKKSVKIEVECLGEGPGMQGTFLTSWRGTTTLARKDWGLDMGAMDVFIGETVDLEILIESGRPDRESTPEGKVALASNKN